VASTGLVKISDEDRATLLQTTEEETDRLTRLVTNLLDMSRIQAGALVPHRSATPLDELIGAVAGRLGPMLATHRLSVEVPDGLPLADVDYLLVEQVLSNLLENAARYTPPGTAVTVGAVAVDGGREVEVAVAGGVGEVAAGRPDHHHRGERALDGPRVQAPVVGGHPVRIMGAWRWARCRRCA